MGAAESISVGISGVDAAAVFRACVDAELGLRFGIVPGLSDNGKVHMDLEDGKLVGYVPSEGRVHGLCELPFFGTLAVDNVFECAKYGSRCREQE